MTSNLQYLSYNQSVPYKDGFARIISQNLNNTVWIEYNGQRLLINKNDLFGINEQKDRRCERRLSLLISYQSTDCISLS